MTYYAKAAGAWRTITQPYARVGGAWQPMQEVWSKVGGTWRKIWPDFGALDTQVMTTGTTGSVGNRQRGFKQATFGALADGTSNIYGGAAIIQLYHDETANEVYFLVQGLRANSGWETMRVGATTFTRASATYQQGGGNTLWFWVAAYPFGSNPTIYWD